jgi:hypothetical protein
VFRPRALVAFCREVEGMTEKVGSAIDRWRTGFHPRAGEMRVQSLGRVHLQLGEALRLEMVDAGPVGDATVHLQYYIATELGPWALWISCARGELADCETALRELEPPFAEARQP